MKTASTWKEIEGMIAAEGMEKVKEEEVDTKIMIGKEIGMEMTEGRGIGK